MKGVRGKRGSAEVGPKESSEADLLKVRLQQAVDAENYEEAATIRDKLRSLNQDPEQA